MEKRINLKYTLFIAIITMLLFQNALQTIVPFFRYFDEFLALMVIPVMIISFFKKKKNNVLNKYNIFILCLYLLLIFTGLYSSFRYNYQPILIVLADMLLLSKFYYTYILSELIFDYDFICIYKEKIGRIIKVYILGFLALSVINYIFKIWPYNGYRFGIMCNQLFYSHPTFLASSCILLLALLLLTLGVKNQEKYIIIILIILMSTLRFKAIGAAIVILALVFYIDKKNKKISIINLVLMAAIITILSWNQIKYYYIDLDGSARKVLNETSVEIAKDYFPIGTGFATFGSHFSSVNYSPVYSMYGIENVQGIQQEKPSFISDTFWPMMLGQFGIIGCVAYLGIIVLIYLKIQKDYSPEYKKEYIAKIICLVYLLISSTSESAFVNPLAVPLALIIGIKKTEVSDNKIKIKKKNYNKKSSTKKIKK